LTAFVQIGNWLVIQCIRSSLSKARKPGRCTVHWE
jgi:hypothetical protein